MKSASGVTWKTRTYVADGRHVVVELEPLARAAESVDLRAPEAKDAREHLVDLLPVDRLVRH